MPAKQITPDAVERLRQVQPSRRRFADNPVVRRSTEGRCTISLQIDSIGRLFLRDTGIVLSSGRYGPWGNFTDEQVIKRALAWQERHKNFIFLRDELDLSLALDYNFAERGAFTNLGQAESNAKNARDTSSIKVLSAACAQAITVISALKECDAVCAVPPTPEKDWDLPTEIVRLVAEKTGKDNISSSLSFASTKQSIKATSLQEKWAVLEAANLCVDHLVRDRKVILLDDKYQSGTTAQFVASRLYEAGAAEVKGLFCVKTWRNTDNL